MTRFHTYKTALYKALKMLGAAFFAGGLLPADAAQIIIDNLESIIAAALAIDAVVGLVIRHFTDSKPFWRK